MDNPDTVWVFAPANASDHIPFPLVYLLHGWSGNHKQWNSIIDCQEYADNYGFIIVCPDGLYDSWYIDSPVESENQFSSFFTLKLIPTITEKFKVQKDNVFITGLSMGGHGALYLFEMNPSYFRSAGSLSGVLDLTDWTKYYGISMILDLENSENADELSYNYSVIGNMEKLSSTNKEFIVSCGTEDPFYNLNEEFIQSCNENNISVKFIQNQGGHNAIYWRSSIDAHFDFFSKLVENED